MHRRQNGGKASKYKIVFVIWATFGSGGFGFCLWADMLGICSTGERMNEAKRRSVASSCVQSQLCCITEGADQASVLAKCCAYCCQVKILQVKSCIFIGCCQKVGWDWARCHPPCVTGWCVVGMGGWHQPETGSCHLVFKSHVIYQCLVGVVAHKCWQCAGELLAHTSTQCFDQMDSWHNLPHWVTNAAYLRPCDFSGCIQL